MCSDGLTRHCLAWAFENGMMFRLLSVEAPCALGDESVALEDPTDSAYCELTVESNPWLSIRLEMAVK